YQLQIDEEISAKVVRQALQVDLSRMVADARANHPAVEQAKGRAIILLDEVHEYGRDVINALINDMIGRNGFGTQEEPVPVVMVFSLTGPVYTILNPFTEKPPVEPWLRFEPLEKFRQDDDEDILAYEAVLLDGGRWNTFYPDVSDVSLTVSSAARD